MPKHVGFIMDGNRRWAKGKGLLPTEGHKEGAKVAEQVIEWCVESGIEHVTLWALSTENLIHRNALELSVLFGLLEEIPTRYAKMKDHNVEISFMGNRESLPEKYRKSIERMEKELKVDHPKHHVHIAINYGGREEILAAVHKAQRQLGDTLVTEQDFSSYLYTGGMPDVDLVVRTGGNKRLSGFMPWQCVYSELYFSDVFWPDFSKEEFDSVLRFFDETARNFGA